MTESKKGSKQVTINTFFSPTNYGQESDDTVVESERPNLMGEKRIRVVSDGAQFEVMAKMEDKNQAKTLQVQKKAKSIRKMKVKPEKTKASCDVLKKKKQQLKRFISPHAVALDENDDDDEEEEDEDDDVFHTPEAKRARAELKSDGGELVPPGALISDDRIVNMEDIVDISDDTTAAITETRDDIQEDTTIDVELISGMSVDEQEEEDAVAASKVTTKPDDKKKIRPKAVETPVTKNSKVINKTMTKRQQKMQENAASAVVIAKFASVEPLDPVVQARVDMYKMKTDELTQTYSELLVSKHESDAVMQDIYGARLDCDLDVIVDLDKAQEALTATWQKLRDQALATLNVVDKVVTPVIVEFPHEVKCLIVKGIQGRSASLSVVCGELLAAFKKGLKTDDVDRKNTITKKNGFDTDTVDRAAFLAMEMEIKMLAQRTPHGVRPAKANVYEDTSVAALWVWEVGSLEKYFGDEAQKMIKRMRKHRKRLGQQLKALAKVVQLLHQKPVDETKVSAEEAKVGKFGLVVATELQKAKDREAKELEKRNAAEEKKRLDLERQEAKSEEKRKRDREVEEKELESFKAQKKFKSFFAAAAANGARDIVDMKGDQNAEKTADPVENNSTKIARMDATISFLSCTGAASTSEAVFLPHQSVFSSLKHKRNGTREADLHSALSWSGRRHCDPKLGVMKLLQFYENNRPAYYGTFSTRSRLFHGGRRPFIRHPKFDYTIDSDDEWEEEEPGESLSDDENDVDESDEDNLDYDDQWLAYEDEVDYMDDAGEDVDLTGRGEGPSSPIKHKLPSQLQQKRVKAKAVKRAKLEPQIIGPFWFVHHESDNQTDGPFPGLVGELLVEPVFESSLLRKAREYEEEQKVIEAMRLEQQQQQITELEEQKTMHEVKKAAAVPLSAEKIAAPRETKKLLKAVSQKFAVDVTPPKTKTQRTKAKSTALASASSPSPAKLPKQIDSWFKKATQSDSVSTLSKSQESPLKSTDKEQLKDTTSVEIISVD